MPADHLSDEGTALVQRALKRAGYESDPARPGEWERDGRPFAFADAIDNGLSVCERCPHKPQVKWWRRRGFILAMLALVAIPAAQWQPLVEWLRGMSASGAQLVTSLAPIIAGVVIAVYGRGQNGKPKGGEGGSPP